MLAPAVMLGNEAQQAVEQGHLAEVGEGQQAVDGVGKAQLQFRCGGALRVRAQHLRQQRAATEWCAGQQNDAAHVQPPSRPNHTSQPPRGLSM